MASQPWLKYDLFEGKEDNAMIQQILIVMSEVSFLEQETVIS